MTLALVVTLGALGLSGVCIAFGRAWGERDERERASRVISQMVEEARAQSAKYRAVYADAEYLRTLLNRQNKSGRA